MTHPMLARARARSHGPHLPLDAPRQHPQQPAVGDLEPYAGQACPCVLVPKLLRDLGAVHAAKMHKKGEGQNGWSVQDWRDHLTDEEKYYFPMLLRVATLLDSRGKTIAAAGIRSSVARLGREHGAVRKYLDRDELPPNELSHDHGIVEDAYIILYEPEMRQLMRQDRKAA